MQTVKVTVNVFDQSGVPIAGARVIEYESAMQAGDSVAEPDQKVLDLYHQRGYFLGLTTDVLH